MNRLQISCDAVANTLRWLLKEPAAAGALIRTTYLGDDKLWLIGEQPFEEQFETLIEDLKLRYVSGDHRMWLSVRVKLEGFISVYEIEKQLDGHDELPGNWCV